MKKDSFMVFSGHVLMVQCILSPMPSVNQGSNSQHRCGYVYLSCVHLVPFFSFSFSWEKALGVYSKWND